MRTSPPTQLLLVALVILAAALALGGCSDSESSHGVARRITVSSDACAPGWSLGTGGHEPFAVSDESALAGSVSIQNVATGAIIATSGLRPNKTSMLSARLTPGNPYRWACRLHGAASLVSSVLTIDPVHRTSRPVLDSEVVLTELTGPLLQYQAYADHRLLALHAQLAALHRELVAHNVRASKAAWITAHLTWLQIGQDNAAYGAFGELGDQIDGTSDGLRGGTRNPGFTGFHAVEDDLWRRRDLTAASTEAQGLQRRVGELTSQAVASDLSTTAITVNNWTLRCHEILEDGLRDSLSQRDDYGSDSDLLSLRADITATREILNLLSPVIVLRAPHLPAQARRRLATLQHALLVARAGRASVNLRSLSLRKRENVDGAAGAALQALAPVSELAQIGTT